MSQNKIMLNRWNKSSIRNHSEQEHSIAGKVSPGAACRLGQPWTIVPAEQQMERKSEGIDFQEFSWRPALGRDFAKGLSTREYLFFLQEAKLFS